MICDSIENSGIYALGKRFEKAFDFLKTLAPDAPDGTYELDGKNVYAMIQTRPLADGMPSKLETHKIYADIQFVITGAERLVCRTKNNLEVIEEYNPECDAKFFALNEKKGLSTLEMTPRRFAVFFPGDAHYGCLKPETEDGAFVNEVKKVVVKVRVQE